MASNFAIGTQGGPQLKTGDTVFRLPGLDKGAGMTLYHHRGASTKSKEKILHTNEGNAYKFTIGSWQGHHVKTRDTVFGWEDPGLQGWIFRHT